MNPPSPRYVFLDALRGFAALCVLLYHLTFFSILAPVLLHVFPKPLLLALFCGTLGINIFFVLSGFVIAHSLRNNPLSFSSLTRFIGRRHIRLDLPYWTMIALGLGLIALKHVLPATHPEPFPSMGVLATNLLYVQYIFDRPTLLGVSWTLCLEVQFYLLFVALLVVGKRISSRAPSPSVPVVTSGAVVLVVTLTVGCLIGSHFGVYKGFFWSSWQFFGMGVLLYWMWKEVVARHWFWVMMGILVADAGLIPIVRAPSGFPQLFSTSALLVTASTLGAIYFAARRGALEGWSGGRPMQFLGRVSYSLYLTHATVLDLASRVAFHLTGFNRFMAVVWFFVVVAFCFSVAQLFYWGVELPAMRLSNRFKTNKAASSFSPSAMAPIEISQ